MVRCHVPSRWVQLALLRSIAQDKIALAHIPEKTGRQAEMEFLDIKKDSSLLLHAIHSPFYWRILKKTIPLVWFFKSLQKSAKQENS
jgi:hypothetical protein